MQWGLFLVAQPLFFWVYCSVWKWLFSLPLFFTSCCNWKSSFEKFTALIWNLPCLLSEQNIKKLMNKPKPMGSRSPPSVRLGYWLPHLILFYCGFMSDQPKYFINIREVQYLFCRKWGHTLKFSRNITLVTHSEKAKDMCSNPICVIWDEVHLCLTEPEIYKFSYFDFFLKKGEIIGITQKLHSIEQ